MAGGRRTKKRKQGNKTSPPSRAQRDKLALKSLAEKRRAFGPLLAQIVEGVMRAHVPGVRSVLDGDAPLASELPTFVEVGSGLGQLRSLLPARILDGVTHTELSESLARSFAARHPEARVLAADVTEMPFSTRSIDAVLGLCVVDSLSAPEVASREIARVLRPGGRFVHFLDAATNVEPIMAELVGGGLLPLPNFVVDAALLDPSLLEMGRLEEFLEPYHDLLSVPLEQFARVINMLQQAGHPMAKMLSKYAAPFLKRPFDALSAARAFVALTSDMKNSRPMNQALTSLVSTLRQPPYSQQIPFELTSFSTLAHFQARLERHFGTDFGFESRLSSVVFARTFEPDENEALRAHARRVGVVRNSLDWPEPVGLPVSELHTDFSCSTPPEATPQTHVLREAAVYCFVAERTH